MGCVDELELLDGIFNHSSNDEYDFGKEWRKDELDSIF